MTSDMKNELWAMYNNCTENPDMYLALEELIQMVENADIMESEDRLWQW